MFARARPSVFKRIGKFSWEFGYERKSGHSNATVRLPFLTDAVEKGVEKPSEQ